MATTSHMATAEDDARHTPGPDSLPLWNESLWFPFYDPASRIGVVTRIGLLPLQSVANVWMLVTRDGCICFQVVATALSCWTFVMYPLASIASSTWLRRAITGAAPPGFWYGS